MGIDEFETEETSILLDDEVKFVKTEISKENFDEIIGENGFIEIYYKDQCIGEINANSEIIDDKYIFEYGESYDRLAFRVIGAKEGTLVLTNQKAFLGTDYYSNGMISRINGIKSTVEEKAKASFEENEFVVESHKEEQIIAPRRIADGIMMNKPIVTRDGSWLLCCALWEGFPSEYNDLPEERFPNVVRSADGGETFWKIGHADWPDRLIDEPMAAELSDGRVWMLIRGKKEIGQSFSSDGGFTWSPGEDSRLGGPGSRFCLRRLKSGRLLLVNHYNYTGRNNLTAMLSEDDGRSRKGFLTLDGRDDVSYPDAAETADGRILIVYDRKRYAEKEILLAAVTEADILEGRPVSPLCRLKTVLNRAAGGNPNP